MSKRASALKQNSQRKVGSSKKVHHGREKASDHGRSANVSRVLKMYTEKPDMGKMKEPPANPNVRIEPGRKWFSNTRVVSQDKLEQYRQTLAASRENPMSALVKRTRLPVSLFDHSNESASKRANNLLTISPYDATFGIKRRQKQAKINAHDLEELAAASTAAAESYEKDKDTSICDLDEPAPAKGPVDAVLLKGTSRRIWGELYKVVDSSDVIIQVLDVRDPMGTRCYHLEKHLKQDRPFKHMVLLLNKCDLVPEWVTKKWVHILSKEYPTVAFKASMKHPFGKRSLIGLLRQFAEVLKNRKHISVGMIGYPNVGKSSVINTLRGKKVCSCAPIPGETKVWQYIDLTSKVYLIDCPGIVASGNDDVTFNPSKVIKGVVRAEKLDSPEAYIDTIIAAVGKDKFWRAYALPDELKAYEDVEDVLDCLARKWGKLNKGGEPQISGVAVRIIQDLQRGKIPYFVLPELAAGETEADVVVAELQPGDGNILHEESDSELE